MLRHAPVLLAVAALGTFASVATAQSSRTTSRSNDYRTTSSRQGGNVNANGGEFPSWERDVSVGESVPLPTGRPGHHVPGEAIDVGGLPLGVVALGPDRFATALAGGGVIFVGADGSVLSRIDSAACTQPPVAFDANVIATMGATVARVAPDGVLWSKEQPAALAVTPVILRSGVDEIACPLADGSLVALAPGTGDTRWTARLGAPARSLAQVEGVVIAALASGDVVGVDRADGKELWRRSIGVSASAIVADASAAWVSGRGASSRSKDEAPLIARVPLGQGGRTVAGGRDWKLRVGGDCDAAPLLLDDVVAFTCHDGYVRAIDRQKGVGGWRTDLPARAWHSPLVAGGRLEFVLDQTRLLVVLEADNGAVLGWSELSDEDEIFVGPAAWAGNVTVAATSLGRLVMMRWEWDAPLAEEDDQDLIGTGSGGRAPIPWR